MIQSCTVTVPLQYHAKNTGAILQYLDMQDQFFTRVILWMYIRMYYMTLMHMGYVVHSWDTWYTHGIHGTLMGYMVHS